MRLDKGFSWEYPLSVHGLMHNAITNAWRGDPYRIDTLMIFMANMAWNSSMNTVNVRDMLKDKDEDGNYKIPNIFVCDAFESEMVAFADLFLNMMVRWIQCGFPCYRRLVIPARFRKLSLKWAHVLNYQPL